MNVDDMNLISTKLKADELNGPSLELDSQILASASSQAVRNKNLNCKAIESNNRLSNLAAVAASVVITFGLFLIMHQAIQPDEINRIATKTSINDIKFINANDPKPKNYRIARPEMELIANIAPTQQQRDGILRTLELPKADEVLAKMELAYSPQRSVVENELTDAFSEIENLIVNDQLSDARSRYYDLVQSCQSCELPMMLELLIIDSAAAS